MVKLYFHAFRPSSTSTRLGYRPKAWAHNIDYATLMKFITVDILRHATYNDRKNWRDYNAL